MKVKFYECKKSKQKLIDVVRVIPYPLGFHGVVYLKKEKDIKAYALTNKEVFIEDEKTGYTEILQFIPENKQEFDLLEKGKIFVNAFEFWIDWVIVKGIRSVPEDAGTHYKRKVQKLVKEKK